MSAASRLVIGPLRSGLKTTDRPFLIDNDAFPECFNALTFRGRLQKKGTTKLLGRLKRDLTAAALTSVTNGAGLLSANIITELALEATSSITPGLNTLTLGTQTFKDSNFDGIMLQLTGVGYVTAITGITLPTATSALILNADPNYVPTMQIYVTGVTGMTQINDAYYTITAVNPGVSVTVTTPDNSAWTAYTAAGTMQRVAGTIDYATGALVVQTVPSLVGAPGTIDVSYFPGLPAMGICPFQSDALASDPIDFPVNVYFDTVYAYNFGTKAFVSVSFYRSSGNPIIWSGTNAQQFFSSNYFRAMFVTNNVPGSCFAKITSITFGAATKFKMVSNHGLKAGDYVFINEVTGAPGDIAKLNMKTFPVTVGGALGPDEFTVPATTGGALAGGAVQYLTSRSPDAKGDGIRWYDGPGSSAGTSVGFVNFSPPLDNQSSSSTTYLLGARMVIPYGNRLLAIGTFEANSTEALAGPPYPYFGNRIRYCQVGIGATPFYTQIPGPPVSAFAPTNVTAEPKAWASDLQGYGGYIDLDTTDRIISAAVTQDSLILGMEADQRKLVSTNMETDPFVVQIVNPEYGTAGTHAVVPMDKGVVSVGEYGIISAASMGAQRIDAQIIQQVFQINPLNDGFDRICGTRDFVNEVVYITYVPPYHQNVFPAETLVWNYRDASFSVWLETATCYGTYKASGEEKWIDLNYLTWEEWSTPWNVGGDDDLYPYVSMGTPQGFIMLKWWEETINDASMFIQAYDPATLTVTSANHNLDGGMYVGFYAPGDDLYQYAATPSYVCQVESVTINNFQLNGIVTTPPVPGLWAMGIVDQIDISSKQFPIAWGDARKTRIGAQRYFMDTTDGGEFTVNLYGSQSATTLLSTVVRTRPDDSLGLNDNASDQAQIWHRVQSSVIGDTVQLEFTMSDAQMKDVSVVTSPWVLNAAVFDLYPSRVLA